MELVITIEGRKKDLLENTEIKGILAPFHPTPTREPLYLNDTYFHYVTIDDNSPVIRIINKLIQINGVESAYEKPLDLPPM